MRTVTFANEELVREINRSVVPVWFNTDPAGAAAQRGACVEHPSPEQIAAYPAGAGGANVRAYFCDADGKVFHVVEGYWPAEQYKEQLRIALEIFAATRDGSDAQRKVRIDEALTKSMAAAEKERDYLQREYPEEMGKPLPESAIRRRFASLGMKIPSFARSRQFALRGIDELLKEALNFKFLPGG